MRQCPACRKNIMDQCEDGTPRLRSKIVLFTENGAEAKCPSCGAMVPVPIRLEMQEEQAKDPRRYYVRGDARL